MGWQGGTYPAAGGSPGLQRSWGGQRSSAVGMQVMGSWQQTWAGCFCAVSSHERSNLQCLDPAQNKIIIISNPGLCFGMVVGWLVGWLIFCGFCLFVFERGLVLMSGITSFTSQSL